MKNMRPVKIGPRCVTLGVVLASVTLASIAGIAAAQAASCPRKGALGTSRVLAVDAATTPRVGLEELSADPAAAKIMRSC